MMFESYLHQSSVFVTLTYANEPSEGSLEIRDAQLFLKRLRKRLAGENRPRRIRYFLCGEYGTEKGRPHYHAILFGLSTADTEIIEKAWGMGYVTVSEVTRGRIAYTAKYVQKALLGKNKHYEDGRRSEFALMSRRPGLGHDFIEAMAHGLKRQADNPDVCLQGLARVDGRKYPIDRYGRNLLQQALVDMGVDWRKARNLVVGTHLGRGSKTPEEGMAALERQSKFIRQTEGRESVSRYGSNRVH